MSKAIAKVKPKGTLFLTARRISDNPNVRGSLVAVKKLPATTFPLEFSMSAADMPFQGGAFDGELTLTARIDQDGDPLSREKGDVHGTLPKVQVGSKDVRLTIDQVQKEAESLTGPARRRPAPPDGRLRCRPATRCRPARAARPTSPIRASPRVLLLARAELVVRSAARWTTGSFGTWSATG